MWEYQKFNKGARIIISVFFDFLLVSNMFGESEDNQPDTTAVKEEKTKTVDVEAETAEPTAEEIAAAGQAAKEKCKEVFSLSGSGQQASSKFTLEDGFVDIKSTHNGGSNFAMELLDENANVVQLVTNEIGSYNGLQVFAIDAETYQYNVMCNAK
ncbi:hypothetical protein [Exiguobacterium sp. E4787]|uniref:hypothetical protein n=1 Tax=Exiguobacterium sp. E4787 TaxID=2751225 RepID=UPI001BE82E18|nr:hypothetical protein [Exiguobacterium sp. E4787]